MKSLIQYQDKFFQLPRQRHTRKGKAGRKHLEIRSLLRKRQLQRSHIDLHWDFSLCIVCSHIPGRILALKWWWGKALNTSGVKYSLWRQTPPWTWKTGASGKIKRGRDIGGSDSIKVSLPLLQLLASWYRHPITESSHGVEAHAAFNKARSQNACKNIQVKNEASSKEKKKRLCWFFNITTPSQ